MRAFIIFTCLQLLTLTGVFTGCSKQLKKHPAHAESDCCKSKDKTWHLAKATTTYGPWPDAAVSRIIQHSTATVDSNTSRYGYLFYREKQPHSRFIWTMIEDTEGNTWFATLEEKPLCRKK